MDSDNTVAESLRTRVVDSIVIAPPVLDGRLPGTPEPRFRPRRKFLPRPSKTLPDYISTVTERVKLVNESMLHQNLPYRYALRPIHRGLLLDLVLLDPQGATLQQHTRLVNQENYPSILDKMQMGRGFLFDD